MKMNEIIGLIFGFLLGLFIIQNWVLAIIILLGLSLGLFLLFFILNADKEDWRGIAIIGLILFLSSVLF